MQVATQLLGPDFQFQPAQSTGGESWWLRAAGNRIRKGSVDIFRLEELAGHWGRTIRWFSNVLFPTHGAAPGAALASTGGSLIIEFVPGLEEEPVITKDGRSEFPTVVAGQYLTALLRADPSNLDALSARLSGFKGYAVNSYAGTVRWMAKEQVGVELFVPKPDEPGLLVMGDLTVPRASRDAGLLFTPPTMETREEIFEGLLEGQAWTATTFELVPDKGRPIRGTYDPTLRDLLRPMLGSRVSARIQITGPEHDWLPSSSRVRRRYHLVGARPLQQVGPSLRSRRTST
jgi:hypothetical protein